MINELLGEGHSGSHAFDAGPDSRTGRGLPVGPHYGANSDGKYFDGPSWKTGLTYLLLLFLLLCCIKFYLEFAKSDTTSSGTF